MCTTPGCLLCHASAAPAPCLSLQSAPAGELDFDPHQLVALFASLDARGRALSWNLMECAKRLQRKPG